MKGRIIETSYQMHFAPNTMRKINCGLDGPSYNSMTCRYIYRIVICFAMAPPFPTPPSLDAEALTPALRSNTFQNFRLSSAAASSIVSMDR